MMLPPFPSRYLAVGFTVRKSIAQFPPFGNSPVLDFFAILW